MMGSGQPVDYRDDDLELADYSDPELDLLDDLCSLPDTARSNHIAARSRSQVVTNNPKPSPSDYPLKVYDEVLATWVE